jgi:hypothetical protein
MPCTRTRDAPEPPTKYRSRQPDTAAHRSSIPGNTGIPGTTGIPERPRILSSAHIRTDAAQWTNKWEHSGAWCLHGARKVEHFDSQATLEQQLTSNSYVSPLSLLFGELNKLPLFLRDESSALVRRKIRRLRFRRAISARIGGSKIHLLR